MAVDGNSVITAARLEVHMLGGALSLNGMIGLAQRLDVTDNFNFIALKGIGYAYVLDHVPGIYEGSGDMSTIRLARQSLQEIGLAEHGALVEQLANSDLQVVVRSKRGDTLDILRRVRLNNVRSTIEVGSQILLQDSQILFVRTIESK